VKLYRASDPAFADLLLWAWQAGGADGSYYGNLPLIFASLSEDDLKPADPPVLASRRLEGFGGVLRGNFGRDDEFYLLLKQGPGGYRYHRSEGSIILFADGKPLIYDGGEAGEPGGTARSRSTTSTCRSRPATSSGSIPFPHSISCRESTPSHCGPAR